MTFDNTNKGSSSLIKQKINQLRSAKRGNANNHYATLDNNNNTMNDYNSYMS